jgi:hypothetical protein
MNLKFQHFSGVEKMDSITNFKIISIYDRLPLIKELIAKYQRKFGEIGKITYTTEELENDKIKILFSVELMELKHDGWKYIGTIESVPVLNDKEEFTGYENMLYSNNPDFIKYKNVKLRCDHCRTNQQRKTVNVFKNEEKEMLIGTACSKEYFGINVFQSLNKILNIFPKITDFIEESESFLGFSGMGGIDKQEFCKIVYGVIKEYGYMSKSNYDEFSNRLPTSTIASNLYYSTEKEKYDQKIKILDSLKERNILDEVRNYWNSKESDDTFTHNVQMSLKMQSPKEGLLAYAVWEFMKEIEDITGQKKIASRKKNSEHQGTIGEKLFNIEIEILSIYSMESQYGIMHIVSMIDKNDNIIVWKSGSIGKIEKGQNKTIKTAIVKEHSEYKEVKQTIVKNVKFTN